MKRILNVVLCGAALASFGSLVQAQYGAPDGPYQPDAVTALVEKVGADLNQGYDRWHLSRGERDRLNRAEKKLRGFAHDWRESKFDKGDLNGAIGDIQNVLDKNKLSGPERDALWDDVQHLTRMREAYDHHEIGRW